MKSFRQNPSFSHGFARCAAESEQPNLWSNLWGFWAPGMGGIGKVLLDHVSGGISNFAYVPLWNPNGLVLTGVYGQKNVTNRILPATNVISVFSSHIPSAVSGERAMCGNWGSGTNYQLLMEMNGSGGINIIQDVTGTGGRSRIDFAAGSYVAGVPTSTAITSDAALMRAYLGGKFYGSIASRVMSPSTLEFMIGDADGGKAYTGTIICVGVWTSTLTPDTIQQLHVDPLCLLRRRRRALFVKSGNRRRRVLCGSYQ